MLDVTPCPCVEPAQGCPDTELLCPCPFLAPKCSHMPCSALPTVPCRVLPGDWKVGIQRVDWGN